MTGLLASFAYLSAVRFSSDVFVVDVRTPLGKLKRFYISFVLQRISAKNNQQNNK